MSAENIERSVREIAGEIVAKSAEETIGDARRITDKISSLVESLSKTLIPAAIADVIAENQLGKIRPADGLPFSRIGPRDQVDQVIGKIESELSYLRTKLERVGVISPPPARSKSFSE